MTQQVDENKLIAERRAKLEDIRKECNANGHPNTFRREHYSADLQAEFGEFDKEQLAEKSKRVSVAGRIMAKRGPFLVLQDMKGRALRQIPKRICSRFRTCFRLSYTK